MLHRDHIFFIFLSFLSSVGYAGDVPKQPMTVEMVNNNPPTSPQMPDIEFQHNHIGGGSGKRRRADVGSSAGGSIFNFVTAFFAPSAEEVARDREIEDLNKKLTKAMTKTGGQVYLGIPQPDEHYIKNPELVRGFAPQPTPKVVISTPQPAVTPTPAPVVAMPTITVAPTVPCIASTNVETPVVSIPISSPAVLKTGQVPSFLKTTSLARAMDEIKAQQMVTEMNTGKNDDLARAAEFGERLIHTLSTSSPSDRSDPLDHLPPSNGLDVGDGIKAVAAGSALLTQVATAPTAVAGGGTVATASWTTTLGGYAVVAAPWVAVLTIAPAVGIGLAMLHDGIFNPGIGWFPSAQQRAAYHANRAAQNAAKKASANAPTSTGAPSPKKPEEPKDRIINQVQRTEAMKKIKENYRYDKQSNSYKLKDNGSSIKCSRTGKEVTNVSWDGAHGDIEAWKGTGSRDHLGSLDPKTWEMYKGPANDGRSLL